MFITEELFAPMWANLGKWLDGAIALIPNLIAAAVSLLIFFAIAAGGGTAIRKSLVRSGRRDLGRLLGSFSFWAIFGFGLLIALTIVLPSMHPVDIFASLGIGSVAIGFAFKDVLQNWLAGFLILVRRPFRRGDQIVVGDVEGTVQAVETRATLVKTFSGRLVIIPNSDIYTRAVTVKTAYSTARSEITIPVTMRNDGKISINGSFILSVAATIGLAVLCVAMLVQQRRERYEHVVVNNANIVAALAADVSHTIELYDLSLRGVADDLKLPQVKALDPGIRRMVVFDHTLKTSYNGSLQVVDKDGFVTLDSRTTEPTRTNYSDRDFFRVHANGGHEGLYISAPFAAENGSLSVAVSRSIRDEAGRFSGIAVGSIELGYFNEIFRALKLSHRSAVTLYRDDGTVLMRMPFKLETIGKKLSKGGVFQLYPANRTGFFEFLAVFDEIRRTYNFSQVGELPLLLNVGVPTDEIYAGWQNEAAVVGILILALFGLILMSWIMLRKESRLRRNAERLLEERANTDGLTGLSNRRLFDETSAKEWLRAVREKAPIALLMIDADRFKLYNDAHGHQAGDRALQTIARCISEQTRRAGDLGCRYGGEEFAILLPNTEQKGAFQVAERIRSLICETSGGAVTVSVGVSSLVPTDGSDIDALIRSSDAALYEAKMQGRNRSCKAFQPLTVQRRLKRNSAA